MQQYILKATIYSAFSAYVRQCGSEAAGKELQDRFSTPTNKKSSPTQEIGEPKERRIITDRERMRGTAMAQHV